MNIVRCMDIRIAKKQLLTSVRFTEGLCQLFVYPPPVEVAGGEHDGQSVIPPFTLDLDALRATFDYVDDGSFAWCVGATERWDSDPRIVIRGVLRDIATQLVIWQYPPERMEAISQVNANELFDDNSA